jgi:hypothetical protein
MKSFTTSVVLHKHIPDRFKKTGLTLGFGDLGGGARLIGLRASSSESSKANARLASFLALLSSASPLLVEE